MWSYRDLFRITRHASSRYWRPGQRIFLHRLMRRSIRVWYVSVIVMSFAEASVHPWGKHYGECPLWLCWFYEVLCQHFLDFSLLKFTLRWDCSVWMSVDGGILVVSRCDVVPSWSCPNDHPTWFQIQKAWRWLHSGGPCIRQIFWQPFANSQPALFAPDWRSLPLIRRSIVEQLPNRRDTDEIRVSRAWIMVGSDLRRFGKDVCVNIADVGNVSVAGEESTTHILFGMCRLFSVKFEICKRNMASALESWVPFETRQPCASRRGCVLMSIITLGLVRM